MSQYFRKFLIGFVGGLYSLVAIDLMAYGLTNHPPTENETQIHIKLEPKA